MADDVVLTFDEADTELVSAHDFDAANGNDVSLERTEGESDGMAPPLPPEKSFHAFFSYNIVDKWWVRDIVERLEAPGYGFRCCIDDRDFDLGVPIRKNIEKYIALSCKVVVVISPEYLSSQWCSYEAQITMEHDIDLSRRFLIPVMLRECTVPDFIARVTYIDVNNEHFRARFVTALQHVEVTDGGESHIRQARLTWTPFYYNPNLYNGKYIDELTAYSEPSFGDSQFITCHVPHGFASYRIQIEDDEYGDVKKLLSESFYMSCHRYLSFSNFVEFFAMFQIIFFGFTALIIAKYNILVSKQHVPWLLLMCVCFSIVSYFVPVTCMKLKATNAFYERLRKANDILWKCNIMVCLCNNVTFKWCGRRTRRTTISFYYYEWRSCEQRLYDYLSNGRTTARSPVQLRERAHYLLLDHAIEYGQLLVRDRLPTTTSQRHNRQGECLCQFIERTLQEPTVNCCNKWLFNTGSRHPWKLFSYM